MKKGNKIISGALALGLGAIAAKLLGALYRVPLTRILGGEGIGLYQTVFPVYALLLDFAGAAAPSALSALIAAEKTDREIRAKKYLSVSLKIFSVTGIFFSLLMLQRYTIMTNIGRIGTTFCLRHPASLRSGAIPFGGAMYRCNFTP